MKDNTIYIWTDGSGDNKKRNGGCGIVIEYKEHRKEVSLGQFINTTSARMEIKSVLESLRLITNKTLPIILYCDNRYVVDTIDKKWYIKWQNVEWLNRKNADLWKQVLEELSKFSSTVQFQWVKGHSGNKNNEICDKLAGIGAKMTNLIDDTENK